MGTSYLSPASVGFRCLMGGLVLLWLSGCSPKVWMAGPGQTGENFEPTKAHCQIMAQGSETGFVASGSQNFVAGAALGHAIGDAIRASNTFSACMRESGFVPQTREVVAVVQGKKDQIKTASTERMACFSAARQEERFVILRPHFPDLLTGRYSMEQLANQSYLSEAEVSILPAYFDAISVCRAKFLATVSPLVSGSGDLLLSAEQKFQSNALALIHHNIAWGDFALTQQAIQTDLRNELKHLSLL